MNEPLGVEDDGTAKALAALLDRLAGDYRGEPLGHIAGPVAVSLHDRLEI